MSPYHEVENLNGVPKEVKRQGEVKLNKGRLHQNGGGIFTDNKGGVQNVVVGFDNLSDETKRKYKNDSTNILYGIKPAYDPNKRTDELESENPPEGTRHGGRRHHQGSTVGKSTWRPWRK